VGRASYQVSRDDEINGMKDRIEQAIAAGFFNIDLDTSSLADFSRPSTFEQQQLSSRECAELVAWVREIEPKELSVGIGAEIKILGDGNLTADELRAFMEGFFDGLNLPGDKRDLAKLIVLVDGATNEAEIDLELLRELGEMARREYGLGLSIRSGTLSIPEVLFAEFPDHQVSELQLTAPFEDLILDHEDFPKALKKEFYQWIDNEWPGARRADQSDETFYRASRRRALVPFKQRLWDLPEELRARIAETIQAKLAFYFDSLRVGNTAGLVRATVDIEKTGLPLPASGYSQTAEASLTSYLADSGIFRS
jgi:hypothetical protein